jgi:hypothetical protein
MAEPRLWMALERHGTAAPRLRRVSLTIWLSALGLAPAQAHLLEAQRGTLNFAGTGGFVAVALPVDAFTGVDDDGDGKMSLTEMSAHRKDLEAQVMLGLQLIGPAGPRPLQAVMLHLSHDEHTPPAPAAPSANSEQPVPTAQTAPARHVVVLGRFAMADAAGQAMDPKGLRLRLSLFGQTAATQQLAVVVTKGQQTQKLVLSPGREEGALFPAAGGMRFDASAWGAERLLRGWGPLLFGLLMLVGAAAWLGARPWRPPHSR